MKCEKFDECGKDAIVGYQMAADKNKRIYFCDEHFEMMKEKMKCMPERIQKEFNAQLVFPPFSQE